MAETHYKQCTYKRPLPTGDLVEIAWLPEKLAVIGKKVYFGKKTKAPEELWEIASVSDNRLPESYLLNHERDYKTQRQASDI